MRQSLLGIVIALTCQTACQKVADDAPVHREVPSGLALPHESRPEPFGLSRCESGDRGPLSAARDYYSRSQFKEALACAAQATAQLPDDPVSHAERALALAALRRFNESALAFARALALDPDNLDALLGAAYLYAVQMPSSREHDGLGALYSERGLALAEQSAGAPALVAKFAVLSARALNDLGEPEDGLERAELALSLDPIDSTASYERALALFELCRFAEAKAAFRALASTPALAASAHYHLGLLLEREGKDSQAFRQIEKARQLAPDEFPAALLIPAAEFRAEVQRAVAELPEDMRRDLEWAQVDVEEWPRDEDLLGGAYPLSPGSLGIFRGPPLGIDCEKRASCRSVILYRRNLARAVKSREQLLEQIRVTLLHEVGHLRGEDDFELAARGLE
jgi:tetratricopeptide (TPR) repeat protein